jgi:hypothetical protein
MVNMALIPAVTRALNPTPRLTFSFEGEFILPMQTSSIFLLPFHTVVQVSIGPGSRSITEKSTCPYAQPALLADARTHVSYRERYRNRAQPRLDRGASNRHGKTDHQLNDLLLPCCSGTSPEKTARISLPTARETKAGHWRSPHLRIKACCSGCSR